MLFRFSKQTMYIYQGEMVYLVKCQQYKAKDLSRNPRMHIKTTNKVGTVTHVCNGGTQRTEVSGPQELQFSQLMVQ